MTTKKVIVILCIGASLLLPGCSYFKKTPATAPKVEPIAEELPSQMPKVEEPAVTPPAPVAPVAEEVAKPEVTEPSVTVTEPVATIPAEQPVAPLIMPPKIQLSGPVPFKSCGSPSQFTSQTWYADLDAQLNLEDKLDADGAKDAPSTQGKLSAYSLGQLCYSDVGALVLGYYGGGKCLRGMAFRYDTKQKVLERAAFAIAPDKCSASFAGFGKRVGSVIPLKALNISVGSAKTINYDYDFVANTLTAK